MSNIAPMKAAKVSTKTIQRLMEDDDFDAEIKYNGSRYICSHQKKGRALFTSRRSSVKDGNKVEKGDRIPHLSKFNAKMSGTVLDGEVVTGLDGVSSSTTRIMGADPEKAIARQEKEGWLYYMVYDILFYHGKNVQGLSRKKRNVFRALALAEWNNVHAVYVEASDDKEGLLRKAWRNGWEGIVLKHKRGLYVQDARDPAIWAKVKKVQTYDVVIMGSLKPEKYSWRKHDDGTSIQEAFVKEHNRIMYKCINRLYANGWIKSLVIGCYNSKGELVEVGTTSGMSDGVRKKLTGKEWTLNKMFKGRVIEVDGQEVYKDGIIHPRFMQFRDDKDAKECTVAELKNTKSKKRKVRYE